MSALTPGDAYASQRLATALLGPCFIGWAAAFFFFGIFVANFTNYIATERDQRDGPHIKAVLWTVLGLGFVNFAVNLEEMFENAVRQGRSVDDILSGGFASNFQPMLIGLISATVQGFLVRRASKVFFNHTARLIFLGVVGTLIATSLAGALMVAGLGWMYFDDTINNALPLTFNQAVGIWLWCAMAVDLS